MNYNLGKKKNSRLNACAGLSVVLRRHCCLEFLSPGREGRPLGSMCFSQSSWHVKVPFHSSPNGKTFLNFHVGYEQTSIFSS